MTARAIMPIVGIRLNRLTIRPAPVEETLTRAELVAGLRRAYQQAQIDVAAQPDCRDREACLRGIAATLCDVAAQFGLTGGELEEVVGGPTGSHPVVTAAIGMPDHEQERMR
jgi:hypothetical protein